MNKVISTILITLGFVQLSFAQTQFSDADEAYDYWAKRGIIESVYAYMNDYVETVGEAEAKAEIIGKDKYYDDFMNGIANKETLPSYSEISGFLKANSWIGAEKKLFAPLKNKHDAKAQLDASFFICTKPGSSDLITEVPGKNNKNKNWNTTTTKVLKEYNKAVADIEQRNTEKSSVETKVQSNPIVFKNKPNETYGKQNDIRGNKQVYANNFPIYIGLFVIGLLLGGWLIFIISKRNVFSVLSVEKQDYLNKYKDSENKFIFKYLGLVHILKNRKDHYKEKVGKSINTSESAKKEAVIKKLEEENKKHLAEIDRLNKEVNSPSTNNKPLPHTMYQKQSEKLRTVYFNMPEPNGSFNVSDGHHARDSYKYFKIEHKEDSAIGELSYLSSDWDKEAINGIDEYLKPVCEIENITNISASKVTMAEPGKVSLVEGNWVIDPEYKIKIKLY